MPMFIENPTVLLRAMEALQDNLSEERQCHYIGVLAHLFPMLKRLEQRQALGVVITPEPELVCAYRVS